MPGYDRMRIVGFAEEDLEEFICGICLDVFIKPTVTECCGQTYCYDCIKEWLITENVCPNDRKVLSLDQLKIPTRIVINLLNNMKIKCDFYDSGCHSVVKICDLNKHKQYDCDYNPERKCKKCGLAQLNHTDKICIDKLFEKVNELSVKIEKLKEQHDHILTKNDSDICVMLSKIELLENDCRNHESEITRLNQINQELHARLGDNSNRNSAVPDTPWAAFVQKICVENKISPKVEFVMGQVDRAYYCANDPYSDKAQIISQSNNIYISKPSTHAQFLEVIEDKLFPGAKVLDVGSGSGYITACMAYMVGRTGKVIGIEKIKRVANDSKDNISKSFPRYMSSGRIRIIEGNGRKGYAAEAPYDVIHVGAPTVTIPAELISQLKPGGKIVIALGMMIGKDVVNQYLEIINKMPDGTFTRHKLQQIDNSTQPLSD